MKKTLIALLALGSVAMAANITVANNYDLDGTHSADRLDLNFNGSTDRTVTITTTVNTANITGTDGYGMNDVTNIVNFVIQDQLIASGTIKGQGATTAAGQFNVTTSLQAEEVLGLYLTGTVTRDVIKADYISCLGNKANALTFTLDGIPSDLGLTNGGLVVKMGDNYYSTDAITNTGSYWNLNTSETMTLEDNKYYTYVTVMAANGAAPKAIGFVATYNPAVTPEPATATLSLLALAGLAARRKRH